VFRNEGRVIARDIWARSFDERNCNDVEHWTLMSLNVVPIMVLEASVSRLYWSTRTPR
jgi:hypothetical protein